MTDTEFQAQFKLTQEQKAKIPDIIEKWRRNAISTYQPTEAELEQCKREVKKLYDLAGFTPPPDHRIVIASSPFVVRFTVGFAKAIWASGKTFVPLSVKADRLYGKTALETYHAIIAATTKTSGGSVEPNWDLDLEEKIGEEFSANRHIDDPVFDFAMGLRHHNKEIAGAINDGDGFIGGWYNSGGVFTGVTGLAVEEAMRGEVDYDDWPEKGCFEINGDMSLFGDIFDSDQGYAFSLKTKTEDTLRHRDRVWTDIICSLVRPELNTPKWESESFILQHLGDGRYLGRHFAILSLKPIRFNLNSQGRPHCDGDAYCEWADGSKLYALNGVEAPKWLAVTPSEQLKAEDYNRIRYSDTKVEFLRKFGLERMRHFGTSIDSYHNYKDVLWVRSEYELVDMSPILREQQIDYAPHLWMKNLTTGVYHLEAVSPECRTIPDALRFRYGGRDVQLFDVK